MSTNRPRLTYAQSLHPFPEGWYFVASREAVQKKGLIQKTWMGEDIIVWCDEKGRVCVADAYCPHLGADLGPDSGGRICSGRLVCPFHGFEFDAMGQCLATPYAEPPKTARLGTYETQEINDLVFAWWGNGGRKAQWKLSTESTGNSGWSSNIIRTIRFRGHPQETTENSVDLAHLRQIHGYHNVDRTVKMSVKGPHMEIGFDFRRKVPIAKLLTIDLDISAFTLVSGLGYSFVQVKERSIGMDLRLWVLATPVDGKEIDFTLVSQILETRRPRRKIVGLAFLPKSLRAPILNRFVSGLQLQDVYQDVVIWSRKKYRPRPRLCRSDGEIMPFRAYCAQFYPQVEGSKPLEPIASSEAIT